MDVDGLFGVRVHSATQAMCCPASRMACRGTSPGDRLLKGLALHLQGGVQFENALFDKSMIDLPRMDDANGRREIDHQILCVAKQRQRVVPQRFKRSTQHNNLLTTIDHMCSST